MFKFKNGDRLKDVISGFEGVVTGRSDYLTGCNRYFLQPQVTETEPHKLPEGVWFDEPQLEATQALRITLERPQEQPPG